MKRLISLILVAVMLVFAYPINCFAAETKETVITYFEDGSYITESIHVIQTRASGVKSGSKVNNYYDSNGNLDWKVTLNGTFTYTGSGATCTASSLDITIYDSDWSVASQNAGKSSNIARGSATIVKKLLGVTVSSVLPTLTLTCDANGNLS